MIEISFSIFLLISTAIFIIARAFVYFKEEKINIVREIFMSIFFIYFLGVVYVTFFPFYISIDRKWAGVINLIPFKKSISVFMNSKEIGLKNILGNIALLYPLGIFIPLLYKERFKAKDIFKYALLSTLSIEILQYFAAIRVTDIDDIIFNIAGCMLGYITYKILNIFFKKVTFINNMKVESKNLIANSVLFILPILISFNVICKGEESKYAIENTFSSKEVMEFIRNKDVEEYIEIGDSKIILKDTNYGLKLITYKMNSNGRYDKGGTLAQQNNLGYYIIYDSKDDKESLIVFGKNKENKESVVVNYGEKQELNIKNKDIFIYALDIDKASNIEEINLEFQ